MQSVKRFFRDESGMTAAEYGILLGLAAGVLVFGVAFFYQELGQLISRWGTFFSNPPT
jgi:Flp pilus assembly pilin Flp